MFSLRIQSKLCKVWTSQCGDGTLAEDVIFDADALLSGEAESTCRRLEDYFGLPSQREPAGHVPGPAVLATRISSQALGRLGLLLRDACTAL